MACIALNGYHGISKYTWHRNDKEIYGEIYPVFYTDCPGSFKVIVTIPGGKVLMKSFEVTGLCMCIVQ